METKLSRRRCISSLPDVPYPIPSTHLSSHSFWLKSPVGSENKPFRRLSERWRNQFNRRSTAPTKHCVHQTRTQVRITLPEQPVLNTEKQQQENASTSENVLSQTVLSNLNWHSLPHVRTRCHFIFLVPLVALCIGLIAGTLNKRVGRELDEYPSSNKSRRSRWKSVLADVKELNTADLGSISCHKRIQEDEDQEYPEEGSRQDYSKLERDYQKFLSECGMNEHG